MRISLNWLQQYVDIDQPVEELAERLTMAGLEVESLAPYNAGLDNVVTARITGLRQIAGTLLSICDLEAGERKYEVVCGAENIKVGDVVPLALPGAVLSGTIVERSVVKDQVSEGMLCSEAELGFGMDKSGVMVLSGAVPGLPLSQALGLDDFILEISLTPNRADCLSVIGIAREVAALLNKTLKYPEINLTEDIEDVHKAAAVKIEAQELCRRYAARVIRNIRILESPLWLRVRLMSIGIRPINNVVDVTNYVLMEYGQPLHAFDLDLLAEHRIRVIAAVEGDSFTTLDNVSRTLSENTLMIADAEKYIAVAGVMGGQNSEINSGTSSVLIESACFEPASVRRTRRQLNLSTEASYRFERGVDAENVVTALDRAAALMVQASGGSILRGHIDIYPGQFERRPITVNIEKVNKLIGVELRAEEIRRLLDRLGLETVKSQGEFISVLPASYRGDLTREIDIVEEVARLNGYDKIPVKLPVAGMVGSVPNKMRQVASLCRTVLNAENFSEAITYSFMNEEHINFLKIPETDDRGRCVHLLNPLAEDQSVLRTSLLPNLLGVARLNLSHQNSNLRMFEIGKVFISEGDEKLPDERVQLAGFCTGLGFPESVHFLRTDVDFFDIKGPVEVVLKSLGVNNYNLDREIERAPYLSNGAAGRIVHGRKTLGFLGELDAEVLDAFDIKQKVFVFELSFDDLVQDFTEIKSFSALPKYPAVVRDTAVIISEAVPAGEVLNTAVEEAGAILENAFIFDVYRGKQIEQGCKSLALRLVYRSPERTLEDAEVNGIHNRVTEAVISRFNGKLRE